MKNRFHVAALAPALSRWTRGARSLLLLAFGFASLACWAQTAPTWRTLGPAGGTLTVLLADPVAPLGILYAGSDVNGMFISKDGGSTWTSANSGMGGGRHIHALASLGSFVYAATDDGVYFSSAGGTPAWSRLQSPQTVDPAPACAISMLQSAKSTLYMAAACEPKVYATGDAGRSAPTWVTTPLPLDANVSALGLLGDSVAVGSQSTIYRQDANQNWINSEALTDVDGLPVLSGLAGEQVAAIVSTSRWAFSCTQAGLVFQADLLAPGGLLSWSRLQFSSATEPLSCNGLALARVGAGTQSVLAMASGDGAFVSSVFDDSTVSAPGLVPGPAFAMGQPVRAALQVDPTARSSLLWAAEFGLYASSAADLTQSTILSLSTPAPLNGPARVDAPSQRLNNVQVQDVAQLGTLLFAIAQTGTGSYVDVMVSADQGANWTRTQLTGLLPMVIHALAADSVHNVLYAATNQGVYYLSQGTGPWTLLGTVYDVRALAVGAQALYAAGGLVDSGILHLLPLVGGAQFAVIQNLPLANFNAQSLVLSGASVYVAGWIRNGGVYDNAVYVASDFVPSNPVLAPAWQIFGSVPFTSDTRVNSLAVAPGVVFMGGSGFLVQNESSAWGSVSGFAALPFSDVRVNALAVDTVNLYVGTTEGLWAIGFADRTVKSLVDMSGTGASALPSRVINGLRLLGGSLFVATNAGLATPVIVPAAAAPAGSGCSMSTAGEPDPMLWLLVLIAALQMMHARRRRTQVSACAPEAQHGFMKDRT